MGDPDAAVRDPKLLALLRDGWEVTAHVPTQNKGQSEWLLFLTPRTPATVTLGPSVFRVLVVLAGLQFLTVALLTALVAGA